MTNCYRFQNKTLIEQLTFEKEQLKDQVMRTDITWQERIELYEQIKAIKAEIKGYLKYQEDQSGDYINIKSGRS